MRAILVVLLLLGIARIFIACDPQKRLNRIVSKHPELVKADTIKVDHPVTIPGITKDTTAPIKPDFSELNAILEQILGQIPSTDFEKLKADLKAYIQNRACQIDPFRMELPGGGFVQAQVKGGHIGLSIRQPERKINITLPLVVMKVDTVIQYNWNMFWIGALALALLEIIGIVLYLKFIK